MNPKFQIFKGGVLLSVGQVVAQVCSFARNIIIARLISPEDFGIAVTFSITISLLEMMSNLSTEKLLIQAKEGNDCEFQNTAHFIYVLRGLGTSTLIYFLAVPLSNLFGISNAVWAFRMLSAIPLIRSFMHLDFFRLQREMNYIPYIVIEGAASILATIAAWPICVYFKDYSAVLFILLLQSLIFAVCSHVVAKRPYGWHLNLEFTEQFFKFGWPLLINGVLMFGIIQGDRFIIGSGKRLFENNTYTMLDLGLYSAAFTLTMAPALMISNIVMSLFLPLLSKVQDVYDQFSQHYLYCSYIVSLVSGLMAIPLIMCGGLIIKATYGQKYDGAIAFVGWFAAMWAVRILRVAPTLAAMAKGDTRNAMVSNVVRTMALIFIIGIAWMGGSLILIAISGFVGELFALVVSIVRLKYQHSVSAMICLRPAAVSGLCTGVAGLIVILTGFISSWSNAIFISIGLMLTLTIMMAMIFPVLRRDFLGILVCFKPVYK